MKLLPYLLSLFGIGLVLSIAILALNHTELSIYYQPVFPWMPLIFAILTATEHYIIFNTIKKNPKRFSQTFMIASFFKLLLILLVTVIYLLIDKSQVIAFVIILFINYLVFTSYEVKALLRLVNRSS